MYPRQMLSSSETPNVTVLHSFISCGGASVAATLTRTVYCWSRTTLASKLFGGFPQYLEAPAGLKSPRPTWSCADRATCWGAGKVEHYHLGLPDLCTTLN